MDQFILFGDSLIQQAFSEEGRVFGATLTDLYIRKLDIVNRGFSGYNTSQALHILREIVPVPSKVRVRFMMIWFGANDARLPNTPGGPQQHVPLDQFKENLRRIATHPCIRAHEGIRVILVTPPPVDERMLELADQEKYGYAMLRRTAGTTCKYARAVNDLGKELNLPVLDVHFKMMSHCHKSTNPNDYSYLPGLKDTPVSKLLQEYLRDGLHLSRLGYELLYKELLLLIKEEWPDQMPEELPFVFPAWDDEQVFKKEGSVASL